MSDGTLTAPPLSARPPLFRLASDARLAKLAAEGSTAAFTTIYERHHQELYRYCRSILRDEHDARDALQNTMIKALRGLQGETREISLRPWLYRIAHNESISLMRRRPADSSMDMAAEVASAEADPETRQRLRNLIDDLELLAPRQRGALVMRELSGLEFDEIAAALETSPAAAKQAVYEARVALHELEEGRELSCDDIRQKISAEDRRLLRGRRVRGHLKSCVDCRTFAEQTQERRVQLAALAPPLPLPIAMGILEGVLGGGGGGGGIAAMLGGGGAAGIGGATLAKLGVAGVVVLGAGAFAIERGSEDPTAKAAPGSAQPAPALEAGRAERLDAYRGDVARGDAAGERGGSNGSGASGNDQHGNGGGNGHGGAGSEVASAGSQGGNNAIVSGSQAVPGQPAPGAETAPAQTSPSPAGGGSSTSNNGNGPASTPPGHGGTPPGQGGVPPGLGTPPPGQGGTAPGQGTPPPGQMQTPPGQTQTPPGPGGTPPAQDAAGGNGSKSRVR